MSEISQKFPVAMVFGVFDGLHPGHEHFLKEAVARCDQLIVVVAHPDIVHALKQRVPHHTLATRMDALHKLLPKSTVVSGDSEIGTWSALREHQPDIVILGYDQDRLGQELEKIGVEHIFITAHHPEMYKSSLLNKKDEA